MKKGRKEEKRRDGMYGITYRRILVLTAGKLIHASWNLITLEGRKLTQYLNWLTAVSLLKPCKEKWTSVWCGVRTATGKKLTMIGDGSGVNYLPRV